MNENNSPQHELAEAYQFFLQSEKVTCSYNYYGTGPSAESSKKEMSAALTFWSFIRQQRRYISSDDQIVTINLFIKDELERTENKYLKTAAEFELIPNKPLKDLLWRENVDFSSFEAFLRRITPEQEKCLTDLCMTFVDVHLSFDMYNNNDRYLSKGAWAFNLLNLDFGFSMYPNGSNDDTKITNKSWTRFISIKEHINDFVVNQYNGKYWWLYRSARSNYMFNSDGKVEIKSHVCPGFWWTLFVHLYFWILCPIIFTSALMIAPHTFKAHSDLTVIGVAAAAFPTVYFAAFALGKFLLSNAISKKWLKIIGIIVVAAVCLFVAGIVFLVITFVFKFAWEESTKLHIPKFITGLFLTTVSLTGIKIIFRKQLGKLNIYTRNKKAIFFVLFTSNTVYLLTLYAKTLLAKNIAWLSHVYAICRDFVSDYSMFVVFVGFCISIAAIFLWFEYRISKGKADFLYKYDKFLRIVSIVIFVGCILYFVIATHEIMRMEGINKNLAIVAGIFAAAVCFSFTLVLFRVNKDEYLKKKNSLETLQDMYAEYDWLNEDGTVYAKYKLSFKIFLQTTWLLEMRKELRQAFFAKVNEISVSIYYQTRGTSTESIIVLFVKKVIPYMKSKDDFAKIKQFLEFVANETNPRTGKKRKTDVSTTFLKNLKAKDFCSMIKDVLSDLAFETVLQNAFNAKENENNAEEAIAQRKREKNERIKKFFSPITKPLRKAWRNITTLKDIWELFNERCPFISKSKDLNDASIE